MVIYLGSVKGGCNGRSKVIPLIARQVHPPSFILIQLVSHNLGITKTLDLINNIECDLLRLNVILPGLKIIWSEILQRRYWHYASECKSLEKAHTMVNVAIEDLVLSFDGYLLRHPNIRARMINLYSRDGAHRSKVGTSISQHNSRCFAEIFGTSLCTCISTYGMRLL